MIFAALLPVVLATAAADSSSAVVAPTHPPITAVRLDEPIDMDGVLSEHVWQNGNAVTKFTQLDPIEGASPTQRTEVRVAYDEDAVYIGARMYDTSPDSIVARLGRRDNSPAADEFTVYFDPLQDKRSGYWFVINAAGVLRDGTLYNDSWDESSWDGVWTGRAKIDEQGWTTEMRIPFSQMRMQSGATQVWGVNFRRRIVRRSEFNFVVYQPSDGSGFVSRFPDLVGIENVSPGGNIEVLPYVTSKGEFLGQADDDNPFFPDGRRFSGDIGGDIKMTVGNNLVLNGTVNPDFGQVEVDPAVVNLSDVETFFQEKRPFFTEGVNIFKFGQQGASNYWGFNWSNPTFFYSRRIGRTPQGDTPDYDYADIPLGSTILGAAKLTGRAGGFNVGTLHALTAKESADLMTSGARTKSEVEPFSYYGVARGQKEFNERRQGLGLMATFAARSFDDPLLRDDINSTGLMTGLDGWTFLDEDKVWVVSGWAGLSHITGNEQRMINEQRSSRRYYQRPDRKSVSVDSSATSLTGMGARLWINKEKGNFFSNSAFGVISPGFEINDMGFQTRSDIINGHIGGGYKWPKTNDWKKYSEFGGGLFSSGDFDGNVTAKGVHGWTFVEFINNYSWNVWGGYYLERDDPYRTRGGPVMLAPTEWEIGNYIDGDGSKPFFYWFETGYSRDVQGSDVWWVEPGIELKPMSNLTFRFGPSYSKRFEKAQYVSTVTDPAATSTYGHRYVFGELEQTTVAANIRLNISFTPNLSLQTFAQPLISAGQYSNIKELAAPRTYTFTEYGAGYDPGSGTVTPPDGAPAFDLDVPNFNFVSLRGNAVLRWEYMPGSAFFLVWTQERSDVEDMGDFNYRRDSDRLWGLPDDNIFLAKVTYYLTR